MKQKQILIIRTIKGWSYANAIREKIQDRGITSTVVCWTDLEEYLSRHDITPENTLLHYRATSERFVTPKAFELQSEGFHLINKAEVLARTGNKFNSCTWAQEHGISLPWTQSIPKEQAVTLIRASDEEVVIKPINSIGGGIHCHKVTKDDPALEVTVASVPGENIIVQELVPYTRMYRVIVIDGKALSKAVFSDTPKPEKWKVSVCLNPDMQQVHEPDPELLKYAERLATAFESEIAFVDIFETDDGYVLSEINTACSLLRHETYSGYDISGDIAAYLVSRL